MDVHYTWQCSAVQEPCIRKASDRGARRQTLRDVNLPPTGRPRETFLEADLQVLLICHRDNSCECFPQMALNIDIWADIFLFP